MKRVYIFLATAIVGLSFGLTGCVQEDPAKPFDIDWSRTATVTGKIFITNGSIYQVPYNMDSKDFIVSVPYRSFNSGASGRYRLPNDRIVYNRNNGEFTITVPVGNGPTRVYVDFSDFPDAIGEYEEVIWKASNCGKSARVLPGQTIDLGDINIPEYGVYY